MPEERKPETDAGSEPAHQSVLSGFAALVIAAVFAALGIFAYTGLRSSHPPTNLGAFTQNVKAVQHLTLTSAASTSQVTWRVRMGQVQNLTASGPNTGIVEIIVPLPDSDCPAVARELDLTCVGGALSLSAPAEVKWSVAQSELISTSNAPVLSDSLDIAPSVTSAGALHLLLYARGRTRPSLCFSSPIQPTRLTLWHGSRSYPHLFTGNERPLSCSAALPLFIGSSGGGAPIELDGIHNLDLVTTEPVATLQGFLGQVTLDPGGVTDVGAPGFVTLSAGGNRRLSTVVAIGPQGESITTSGRATHVTSNGSELVPSRWARNADVWLVIFGAAIPPLVIAPAGVAVQAFMQALRRLLRRIELWLRREWRLPRKRQEPSRTTQGQQEEGLAP